MEYLQTDRVRFGLFELDLTSGELYRFEGGQNNTKTLLREQPFQLLRMLVERDGKIVTREEMREKLWPNDTVVDFDRGINVAVATLRRTLGDAAGSPRYIETLARRGYRLLVSVERLETAAETPPDEPAGRDENSVPAITIASSGLIGKRVSHYRVLEVIGGGGMGMVYKGEDLRLGRQVALKFLPEELAGDPIALRRFEREARTASTLNHPNICTIYEIEEYEGHPFIAMELLEGETLRDRLARYQVRPMPLAELLTCAVQICEGLQAAHDKGIIHRDVKPANIFLTRQGTAKILDFGLAKLAAVEELQETPSRAGTAGYMSPEQVRGEEVDTRTDLFSFGMVLYEMAAGKRAFDGETVAIVHDAILHQRAVPAQEVNPCVPRALDAILATALEKDRARRSQSAGEIRAGLVRIQRETSPAQRAWRKWLPFAALFAVAAGAWFYGSYRPRVTLSPDDGVVIADIINQTSDPMLDDALYIALHTGLEQTPYLDVLSADKVRGSLRLLNLPATAKVTPDIARNICLRTNSKLVITGSVADLANSFRIALSAMDCQSGKTVARAGGETGRRDEIVHLLGVSAVELRRGLGEPPASIAKFNQPLEVATSASPDALHILTEGYNRHLARDIRGAIVDYKRAIALDPNLALAYVALGTAHHNLSEFPLAAAAEMKAYELRARMTQQSRFRSEALYYAIVTGQWDKSYLVLDQWAKTFPRDVLAHTNSGICLRVLGQQEQSFTEARDAARLMPSSVTYYNLMGASILADRPDEALATYNEAAAHGVDLPELRALRLTVAFLQDDQSAMEEQLAWAEKNALRGHAVYFEQARIEYYYGRFRKARQFLQQAIEDAGKSDDPASLSYAGEDALQEAAAGNTEQARRSGDAALQHKVDRDLRATLAFAFASAGDARKAQSMIEALNHEFPTDLPTQKYCLPAARAALKLAQNDPAGAIEVLRPALQYDFALTNSYETLYPAYLRGLAYLQCKEPRLAIKEFQKLLDHPGIFEQSVTLPLSHVQIARAHSMLGDQAAARASYEAFLAIWKNADPGIPIYQQAKAEYARLLKK